MSARTSRKIHATLICFALLAGLCGTAGSTTTSDPAEGRVVVTPEVLLEHLRQDVPELAALPELAWSGNGRRILLSTAMATTTPGRVIDPEDDPVPDDYSIASVDVGSGRFTVIGPGYRPVAAAHGDTVAYFVSGSNGHEVTLARTNGERLCSIRDRDLMPEANGIQAIVLTADGKKLALAVGFTTRPDDRPLMRADSGPAVRVLDTRTDEAEGHIDEGVTLWITDARCQKPRRAVSVPRFAIGRLAWMERSDRLLAIAQTATRGRGLKRPDMRTDLLLLDTGRSAWRTVTANIGGQAQNYKTGFLQIAPSGRSVAFTYDVEALPYLQRRQLAIASIADGRIRLVSTDPREGIGWLDASTLLIGKSGAHPLIARAATLSLDGAEDDIGALPGRGVLSPDGRRLAWLESDLYGNSSLQIAGVRRADNEWRVADKRAIWRAQSQLARYARGSRSIAECDSGDGVRTAAIVMLPLDYTPGRRYPLIVDIHGGPRGGLGQPLYPYTPGNLLNRSTLEHDMWAALGYVVLTPDYRASGLYGFDKARRDGGGFEDDVQDIMCHVQASIDRGEVDPARMAVIGHSYGGMEVNWIVTHSHRFKAAISKEGSFNVSRAVAWGSRGKANQQATLLFGTPYEYPERYRRMSVMDSVRGVSTPTMFVEHRGGKRAGDLYAWMFAAWQEQGVPAQLRLYDEEKHALRRPADWEDMLNAAIEWFDEHVQREHVVPVSDNAERTFKLP